jgi:hypothetical protein
MLTRSRHIPLSRGIKIANAEAEEEVRGQRHQGEDREDGEDAGQGWSREEGGGKT